MESIYLDHNATTPIHPEVAEAMRRAEGRGYANPASQHQPGQRARRALEGAKERIAHHLGVDLNGPPADRLVLTSGGTEANNLAVRGIALARSGGGPGQVVVSAMEHSCVLGAAEHLLERGWRIDMLGVSPDGLVREDRLAGLLSAETALVSVIAANHEIGTLQPIDRLAAICHEKNVPLHTDAVQMAGKLPIDFCGLGVDAMTVAAHKFHGPLGIGALILRHDVPIEPLLFGGHQQGGLRPGTESIALAEGMAAALEIWHRDREAAAGRMTALRERFERRLLAGWPEVVIHGADARRLPNTSCIAFPGLDGQVLFTALDLSGVACSIGSACSSGSTELSPTLLALNLPKDLVAGSLRFSLGSGTTESEIDEAVRRILSVCSQLRG